MIWVYIEDLFDYFAIGKRPSGIQRFAYEICQAIATRPGVHFCRHNLRTDELWVVGWDEVSALYRSMSDAAESGEATPALADTGFEVLAQHAAPRPALATPLVSAAPPPPGHLRRLARRLPAVVRYPLAEAVATQAHALSIQRNAFRLTRQALRGVLGSVGPEPERPGGGVAEARVPITPAAGDTLLIPGSPWSQQEFGAMIGALKARHGLQVALVSYDLIPLLYPEWCDAALVRAFRHWLDTTLPHVDRILAISRATAADLQAWVRQSGVADPFCVVTIPVGTGFGDPRVMPSAVPPPPGDPGYVLFVSTMEARKNHALAFRAWRHLLNTLPREQVPTLVFAGREGWLVSDLVQQIRNADGFGGKLVRVDSPSDAELRLLYRDCRFTLFPSLYEGWGLPVTESLSFGRVCVASNRASVPEAGGEFCLYVDPDDVTGATAVLRDALLHPERIEALERRIREAFRPVPWSDSAAAILRALGVA